MSNFAKKILGHPVLFPRSKIRLHFLIPTILLFHLVFVCVGVGAESLERFNLLR